MSPCLHLDVYTVLQAEVLRIVAPFLLLLLCCDVEQPWQREVEAMHGSVLLPAAQALACWQDGSGTFEPILPREELEAMYRRILAQEIPLPSGASGGDHLASSGRKRGLQASKLAAALGLSHLFRSPFQHQS